VNPEELLYAKTHEWVRVEDQDGGKLAVVGLSAFALEALTDLVYIELPEVDRQVAVGESFGEIESVKAVSDLYAPVTGDIVDVNTELPDRIESLGDDPYDTGWIIKIRITDESGLGELMDHTAYQKQCEEEGD
jgi:glycine cleavage system H protein